MLSMSIFFHCSLMQIGSVCCELTLVCSSVPHSLISPQCDAREKQEHEAEKTCE